MGLGRLRVKCSCGEVMNVMPGDICSNCKKPIELPPDGMITLYRMGSPLGIAGGFGIYINGEPYGYIGNKESVHIPLPYGAYNIHIACGMNRRCTDIVVNLTPENRRAYAKLYMKPGFWSNSFVLFPTTAEEMPEV